MRKPSVVAGEVSTRCMGSSAILTDCEEALILVEGYVVYARHGFGEGASSATIAKVQNVLSQRVRLDICHYQSQEPDLDIRDAEL